MTIVESKIVTVVDADVSAAKREMEMFRASQQKAIADTIKGIEDQNKKLGDNAATWAKVGVAVAGVAGAIKFAQVAWKAYVDRSNAEAATYGVSLEELRKASAGLKTDTELLAFAEQQLSKDLALTRKEMETVLRAQVALARNGRDAAKVEEAVGAALTKNTVKPLKEIGIILKQNEDPAKNFTQIMEALSRAANDAGAAQAEVGENVQRAGVQIQNAWTDVKVSAGKLVDEGLAPLAGALSSIFDLINDFLSSGALTESDVSTLRRRSGIGTVGEAWTSRGPQQLEGVGLAQFQGFAEATLRNMAGIAKDVAAATQRATALNELGAGAAKKAAEEAAKAAAAARSAWEIVRREAQEGDAIARAMQDEEQNGSVTSVVGDFVGRLADLGGFSDPNLATLPGEARAETKDKLAQIFGPLEKFDAYATAWSMLEGSVTSALDAWITGSRGAGEAVKLFIAESMRALALDMGVRALREFATAAAMAANPLTVAFAPGHAKAGALYAGGALAAGIAAKALGGGGGGMPAAAGGGGAAAAVASPVAAASQTTFIIATGNDFAEDSPRARLHKARQLARTAQVQAGHGGEFR